VILASDQKAWLVPFVGISVPGKTPAVFVSEVTNPAQMQGRISYPIEPMIARLPPRRRTAAWHIRFGVGADVAESTTEAHVDSSELSLVVLVSVIDDASLGTGSYCGGGMLFPPVWGLETHIDIHAPSSLRSIAVTYELSGKRFARHSTLPNGRTRSHDSILNSGRSAGWSATSTT